MESGLYALHEAIKVRAFARGKIERGVEQVHEISLAAADPTAKINSARCACLPAEKRRDAKTPDDPLRQQFVTQRP